MDDDDLEGFLAGGLNMQVGDKWGQSGTYITVMFILCGEEGSFYLPPGGACRIGRFGGGMILEYISLASQVYCTYVLEQA